MSDYLDLAELTYNALAEMSDRLAVAIAGHERAAELFVSFGMSFHVEQKRLEMEAALQEAERLGNGGPVLRLVVEDLAELAGDE